MKREMEENMQMLHRIVAMLFSLSTLAQRSTKRSRIVRRTLCWMFAIVLKPVSRLITDVAHDIGLHPDFSDLDFSQTSDSADDLMNFAYALGELAQTLQMIVDYIEQLAPPERDRVLATISRQVARHFTTLMPAFDIARVRTPYFDTS